VHDKGGTYTVEPPLSGQLGTGEYPARNLEIACISEIHIVFPRCWWTESYL